MVSRCSRQLKCVPFPSTPPMLRIMPSSSFRALQLDEVMSETKRGRMILFGDFFFIFFFVYLTEMEKMQCCVGGGDCKKEVAARRLARGYLRSLSKQELGLEKEKQIPQKVWSVRVCRVKIRASKRELVHGWWKMLVLKNDILGGGEEVVLPSQAAPTFGHNLLPPSHPASAQGGC